jgi:hypothetical protein
MTDREAFEKWLEKDEGVVRFGMTIAEEYKVSAWEVWIAATKAERERCAKICENNTASWADAEVSKWIL